MTRVDLAREAIRLRRLGLTQREVGEKLGISRSYASELESDPTGLRAYARKCSYAGTCEKCGGRTNGYNGPASAASVCIECFRDSQHEGRRWTPERIVEALQRWAAQHGRPPRANEWIVSQVWRDDQGEYRNPNTSTVYQSRSSKYPPPFPSWASAIEAAGFPCPTRGGPRIPVSERWVA